MGTEQRRLIFNGEGAEEGGGGEYEEIIGGGGGEDWDITVLVDYL